MSHFERYLTTPSQRYFIMTLIILLLIALLGDYLLRFDYRQQHHADQLRNEQLQQQITTLNQKLSSLPIPLTSVPVFVVSRFAVSDIIRTSVGRLIHWQPDQSQAMLELSLEWENVPVIFKKIENYQDIILTSFKMTGTADRDRVNLILEFSYEIK